jgi:hypothetical protein
VFHSERPEHLTSGFTILRSLKARQDKGSLKGQPTCISTFQRIGYWGLENQELGIASSEVTIESMSR